MAPASKFSKGVRKKVEPTDVDKENSGPPPLHRACAEGEREKEKEKRRSEPHPQKPSQIVPWYSAKEEQ